MYSHHTDTEDLQCTAVGRGCFKGLNSAPISAPRGQFTQPKLSSRGVGKIINVVPHITLCHGRDSEQASQEEKSETLYS